MRGRVSYSLYELFVEYMTFSSSNNNLCTVDPRLSEQQWPEDSKNHADK